MRILEINKFYFLKGGTEKHFFDVINLLKNNNDEVAVFSMKHPRNRTSKWSKYFLSTVGYDKTYTIWQRIKGIGRMFYSREARKKINKILNDFQPEVVHIHNVYHQLSPIILFEIKKRGIPIIMTVHDYKLVNPNYNLYHKNKFYNCCLNNKFYQCFFDKCIKNSYLKSLIGVLEMYWHEWLGTYSKNIDQYIVPSEFAKNILIKWGINSSKIFVKAHFVLENTKERVERMNIRKGKNIERSCLYVGRIIDNKGIKELINIFTQINSLKLYLAGEVDASFKKIENKNIYYLGHLGQSELKKYISRSEFIISPSKLPETFGLIALEANILGKPFVGYRTGAYPEIIKNKQNGFLVKNKEELINFLMNYQSYTFDNSLEIRQKTIDKYGSLKYYKIFKKNLDKFK
jgi:glycosyltransferase involved in cell wall biosynthesis